MPRSVLDHILAATHARPYGRDRWIGHCLAHGSTRHRDFSIRKTEARILIHCFAGCDRADICRALNIRVADLFFDARIDPAAKRQRDADRRERARERKAEGLRIDGLREAESLVRSARGLDISRWSAEELDMVLNRLADAYDLLEKETTNGGI